MPTQDVHDLWRLLSQRQREVMQLVVMNGFSNTQISEQLNLSLNTVKSHRLLGRKRLGIRNGVDMQRLRVELQSATKDGADVKQQKRVLALEARVAKLEAQLGEFLHSASMTKRRGGISTHRA